MIHPTALQMMLGSLDRREREAMAYLVEETGSCGASSAGVGCVTPTTIASGWLRGCTEWAVRSARDLHDCDARHALAKASPALWRGNWSYARKPGRQRVIPTGERRFRRLIAESVEHYHRERNHQVDNRLIAGPPVIDVASGVAPVSAGRSAERLRAGRVSRHVSRWPGADG